MDFPAPGRPMRSRKHLELEDVDGISQVSCLCLSLDLSMMWNRPRPPAAVPSAYSASPTPSAPRRPSSPEEKRGAITPSMSYKGQAIWDAFLD